jgi:hypothetical protein
MFLNDVQLQLLMIGENLDMKQLEAVHNTQSLFTSQHDDVLSLHCPWIGKKINKRPSSQPSSTK